MPFNLLSDPELNELLDPDSSAREITRQLDIIKADIFLNRNAAFLAYIMGQLDYYWSMDLPSACTDGVSITWNPLWFGSLNFESRKFVFLHELWHVARLHPIRLGSKDPYIWNIACDHRINLDLRKEGFIYSDEHYPPYMDPRYSQPQPWAEEDIYNDLMKAAPPQNKKRGIFGPINAQGHGDQDLFPGTSETQQKTINNTLRAIQQARISNQAGTIPGDLEETIKAFLAPVVPWEQELQHFMNDLLGTKRSWMRPSRRHLGRNVYLPSYVPDKTRLEHLMYFFDTSGSISKADLERFNSEVRYIKTTFRPKKLTLVQFDTRITRIDTYGEEESFDELKCYGRGGTSLEPVREMILREQPNGVIIFSDLYCTPMLPLPIDIPIIWVVVNNPQATVKTGKIISIK